MSASDLEARVAELASRLAAAEERLADAEGFAAILDLKSRYGALADARYVRDGLAGATELDRLADALAALFTVDAVWEGGGELGTAHGRDAIRARFREPTLAWAWHFFVKPEIHVEGDRAHGTWDVLAMMTTRDGRAMWMVGVEHDEYVREGGRWLHSRMHLDAKRMAPYDRGWTHGPGARASRSPA